MANIVPIRGADPEIPSDRPAITVQFMVQVWEGRKRTLYVVTLAFGEGKVADHGNLRDALGKAVANWETMERLTGRRAGMVSDAYGVSGFRLDVAPLTEEQAKDWKGAVWTI